MRAAVLAASLLVLVSAQHAAGVKECADGDQADYRGHADTTATGKTCQRWDVNTPTNTDHNQNGKMVADFAAQGLGGHNYCRNPYETKEAAAFCFTDTGKEPCKVPQCTPSSAQKLKLTGTAISLLSPIESFDLCKAKCKVESTCVAVQYTTSGAQDKACRLFSAVTDASTVPCTDCFSAYRPSLEKEPCDMAVTFDEALTDKEINTESMVECKEQCLQMEDCKAVTWDSTDNKCMIRNGDDYTSSEIKASTERHSAIRTCFQREGYRVTCDAEKNLCPKLAKDMMKKGARVIVSGANKDSVLEGIAYSDDGVQFNWRIRINEMSESEYGKGEAWLEGCRSPISFQIDQLTIDGAWDFKTTEKSQQIYHNGEMKVNYPFLDKCSERLRDQKWNGITLVMLKSPMKDKVGVPPAGFDIIGAWPEGGKACSYDAASAECNKLLLPEANKKGIAIWPTTMKTDAVVKFGIHAKLGDNFVEIKEVMVKIDSAATNEEERGLASVGDCGPFKFKIPYEVRTLSGEWIMQFSDSHLLVWWNKMPLLELPYTEDCLAVFLVDYNGKKVLNPAFAGIAFKDVDFDMYYGYPMSDLNQCKWQHYSDMQCRPAEQDTCALDHVTYCACGGLYVAEQMQKCRGEKPEPKRTPCHCEGQEKRCFWSKEPGMCHMADNFSCARRVFFYCSCGEDRLCDGERRPATEKGYCMDYECYGGGSVGVIGSLLLLVTTLFFNNTV